MKRTLALILALLMLLAVTLLLTGVKRACEKADSCV